MIKFKPFDVVWIAATLFFTLGGFFIFNPARYLALCVLQILGMPLSASLPGRIAYEAVALAFGLFCFPMPLFLAFFVSSKAVELVCNYSGFPERLQETYLAVKAEHDRLRR